MKREFTTSVYIIEDQKVLLLFHRKLQKWLPPGGHIEMDETPPEAARREVKEETGLEIEFLAQENTWVNCWNACSFERPYLCLLENIPPYKSAAEHQHMDLIYVARPIKGMTLTTSEDPIHWFTWEELELMERDKDIFGETLQVIRHLLSHVQVLQPYPITVVV